MTSRTAKVFVSTDSHGRINVMDESNQLLKVTELNMTAKASHNFGMPEMRMTVLGPSLEIAGKATIDEITATEIRIRDEIISEIRVLMQTYGNPMNLLQLVIDDLRNCTTRKKLNSGEVKL